MIKHLALSSLVLLVACANTGAQDERRDVACAIITEFIAEEFDQASKPLFVTSEKPLVPRESNARATAYKVAPHPIEACPEVAKIRREKSYTPPYLAPGEPPETSTDGLFYLYDTLSISLPLLDDDGESYKFEVVRVCGPLCAGGNTVTYRRQSDGTWRKDREEPSWIS
ncbi:hypothetical protein AAG602_04795 [Citromicrobium bathyomarinum]